MADHRSNASKAIFKHLMFAGAATLAAAPEANAAVHVFNVGTLVGYAAGDQSSVTLSGIPAANPFNIARYAATGRSTVFPLGLQTTQHTLRVRQSSGHIKNLAGAGRHYGTITGGVSAVQLASAGHYETGNVLNHNIYKSGASPSATYSNEYNAFKFSDPTNGGRTEYGWIETSATDGSFANETVNVMAYAYDDSGAQLPTGATTSASAAPEAPTDLAMLAFSALTLGSAAMRRLKAVASAQSGSSAQPS